MQFQIFSPYLILTKPTKMTFFLIRQGKEQMGLRWANQYFLILHLFSLFASVVQFNIIQNFNQRLLKCKSRDV